jgi:dienelactone hydrolase
MRKRIFLGLLFAIIIAGAFLFLMHKKEKYVFLEDRFSYDYREASSFTLTFNESKEDIEIYKITFPSRPLDNEKILITGLLFLPKNKEESPGILLLPGGGGTKEGESKFAMFLAKQGFAVLTIDQRGVGETSGTYLSIEQDLSRAMQGKEPVQHLSVYDILHSYDVLKQIKQVRKNDIILIGESMGGRYAIIAAAQEKNIKGVIVISSSGFHVAKDTSQLGNNFLRSIDPDRYINQISPRPIAMIQILNDSVVTLKDAQITFTKANEPKKIFILDSQSCGHGYCPAMQENITDALQFLSENSK